MYKMFVNEIQVGTYKSVKEMMGSAILGHCCGKTTTRMKWIGNNLFLTVF